jgi:hypothetical protein
MYKKKIDKLKIYKENMMIFIIILNNIGRKLLFFFYFTIVRGLRWFQFEKKIIIKDQLGFQQNIL